MKLLIAGAGSPVGKELIYQLKEQDVSYCVVPDRLLLSRDQPGLDQLVKRHRPGQLINLHQFKPGSQLALERAETQPEECAQSHVHNTRVLTSLAGRHALPFLHLSTCYVFDGEKRLGYNEQDEVNPVGVYGKSALQGEREVEKLERSIILRTGWLFGRQQHDLLRTWIKSCKKQDGLVEVIPRRFSPTPNDDLARVILAVCRQVDCDANVWGVYHFCGLETKKEGEFALQVLKAASQHDEQVYQYLDSFTFRETRRKAPHIANSSLSSKKIFDTFGIKQRSWQAGLQSTVKAIYQSARGADTPVKPLKTVKLADALSSKSLH